MSSYQQSECFSIKFITIRNLKPGFTKQKILNIKSKVLIFLLFRTYKKN